MALLSPTAPVPTVAPPKGHMVQLDGLRALAALAVIAQHFTPLEDYTLVPIGLFGVWAFFVLSGFLITGILRRAAIEAGGDRGRTRDAWKAFYLRRVLRIFPLYYATLLGAALLNLPGVRRSFWWYFGHLANVADGLPGVVAEPLAPFWSLAVEEQFYLVWPALVLFAPRRWVVAASLAMVLIAPPSRLAMMTATGDWRFSKSIPPSCLDGLGMGALLALIRESGAAGAGRRRVLGRAALAGGLAILGFVVACRVAGSGYRIPFSLSFTSYSLISFWVVDRAADGFPGWPGAFLRWGPMAYVGRISYGVYVLHFAVPSLVEWTQGATGLDLRYPAGDPVGRFLYVTVASVALASISWFAYERPINDLKRFFPYARRPKEQAEIGPA